MQMYPAQELERAMKVKEVITRAMSGQINWIQAAEIWGCRTASCGGGGSDGRHTAMTGCSIGGPSGRVRNGCRWPRSSKCCGCTGSGISI